MTAEILEVVEGVMIVLPVADDDSRINFAVEVLEAVKSWSNLMLNHPMEMMSSGNLRNWSEVEVRVVDQASCWIG